ncbi:unnamed protein product [Hapterophycus canaliculatus]
MNQFVGDTVCVVGKVVSHQEGDSESQIETSDGTMVTVQMSPGSSWTSQYVEVIGHLHEGNHLQEFKSSDYGETFDMVTYNKAVALMTGKFSYLFYNARQE